MKLDELCHEAIAVVREVSTFIHGEINKISSENIDTKSRNSLVSYVDRTAEEKLVEGLSKLLPTSTFLTEEETVEQVSSDLRWIIDPLDGTTNYLHKLPCYSVSVGLEIKGALELGIIHDIPQNNVYYAWKGGGAYRDADPISVSDNTSFEDALIATGFPYHAYQYLDEYLDILNKLITHTRGIRRFGSAAIDLAYTACGYFDGFYEYSLNAWDIAGGVVILKEAGGVITSFSGDDQFIDKQTLIAANPVIHEALLNIIRNYKAFV